MINSLIKTILLIFTVAFCFSVFSHPYTAIAAEDDANSEAQESTSQDGEKEDEDIEISVSFTLNFDDYGQFPYKTRNLYNENILMENKVIIPSGSTVYEALSALDKANYETIEPKYEATEEDAKYAGYTGIDKSLTLMDMGTNYTYTNISEEDGEGFLVYRCWKYMINLKKTFKPDEKSLEERVLKDGDRVTFWYSTQAISKTGEDIKSYTLNRPIFDMDKSLSILPTAFSDATLYQLKNTSDNTFVLAPGESVRDALKSTGKYTDDSVIGRLKKSDMKVNTPVYYLKKDNQVLFTSKSNEAHLLTTEQGWEFAKDSGISFFSGGDMKVYRYYHSDTGSHYYSTNSNFHVFNKDYTYEGVAFKISSDE